MGLLTNYSQLVSLSPKMFSKCGKHNFPGDENDFHGKRRILIELKFAGKQFSLSLRKSNAQIIDMKCGNKMKITEHGAHFIIISKMLVCVRVFVWNACGRSELKNMNLFLVDDFAKITGFLVQILAQVPRSTVCVHFIEMFFFQKKKNH